ncbi:MAG: 2-isopropylmalate synthase [Chloroflexi bacterium]|nr:2-isopropylmalate synthase [Chloroflexota bacterium]MCY3717241.1 2-isopropylmalate synthase [Chloroflexota bacterium]MDE2651435.1 2-isopropylmalate synthase [Chloroflexota bacterium]MXV92789.1 2-isopropylmalate synthase [Chloroflexota bacterium]MXX52035.1 2-isopropylmalate synthase [Chloroflexota bacterium]
MPKRSYDENTVIIFDTTLRDGEQSPGATLSSAEKLEIARQLSALGVDVIEAGFPAASPDDLRAVQRIAREVGTAEGPTVAGLARAVESDIRTAWEGVKQAAKPRIHTFLGTSPSHLAMLRIDKTEGLQRIREAVSLAKSLCDDVEFSPMDAGRTDTEYLIQACAAAVECGATTLNIPDTVGYVMPSEWADTLEMLINETPGAGPGSGVIWSVHCHNDLGLATANTLAGLKRGVRQVEVTINGIGERAGNTSLEEVVMAIHTRKSFYDLRTNIDSTQIMKTSRMVRNYMGMPVQPNKAIVGANAFAHESGIHQDGVLKNAKTFEIMTPETVGLTQSKLVLGKHSGRHALRVRLSELGYDVTGDELMDVFRRFKALADMKKTVTDADLEALVADEAAQKPEDYYRLVDIQVVCGTMGMPTATVKMTDQHGEEIVVSAVGTGPVDASYRAVDAIIQAPCTLLEFNVNSVTEGIDALGEVTVRIAPTGGSRTFGGYGAHSDIVVSSVKAYVAALNRMIASLGSADVAPEGDIAVVGLSA